MLRRAASAAVVLLGIFHGWLFLGQLWDGRALEPTTAARWAVAAGLVAALVALRRSGHAVVVGRRAAAVWLLAALLHGPQLADRAGDAAGLWAEAATAAVTAGAAAGAGLALGLLLARRLRRPGAPAPVGRRRPVPRLARVRGALTVLAARPPPPAAVASLP